MSSRTNMLYHYIMFKDEDGELRAGMIHKIEGKTLTIYSLRVNNRGVSKSYYYTLKESDIIEFITKDEAIEHVNSKNINTCTYCSEKETRTFLDGDRDPYGSDSAAIIINNEIQIDVDFNSRTPEPDTTSFSFNIHYCPMCGREL